MSRKTRSLCRSSVVLTFYLAAFFVGSTALAAKFIPLGDFPGGHIAGRTFQSKAFGISGDGSTVVGQGHKSIGNVSFRWSETEGVLGNIPHLPGGDPRLPGGTTRSVALDTSVNGSVIVGSGKSDTGTQAFRWEAGVGLVGLGKLTPLRGYSSATAVSSDGDTVVGRSGNLSPQAFIWREETGMLPLGTLGPLGPSPASDDNSGATGVSADGSVIVGMSTSPNGPVAFRWTQETGMIGLGDLPGGMDQSQANAISADGSTITGFVSTGEHLWEAFRWTEDSEMIGLGAIPGHAGSYAYGVSEDGSVIVGSSFQELPVIEHQEAFVWTEDAGMQSLQDILVGAGLDLDGWVLMDAIDISDDGTRIVGSGINPDGNREAWLALLPVPEPTGVVLALLAVLLQLLFLPTRRFDFQLR